VLLAAGVVVAVLVIGFILSATVLRSRDATDLGDDFFRNIRASDILVSVGAGGPVFFADLTDGKRDIYVTHLGDDPVEGFVAFSARHPDTGCLVQWEPADDQFVDICDDTNVIGPDGAGLDQYPVELINGFLQIDINFADRTE
jgi:hypothetical protein